MAGSTDKRATGSRVGFVFFLGSGIVRIFGVASISGIVCISGVSRISDVCGRRRSSSTDRRTGIAS
jgi:hypothetical protein